MKQHASCPKCEHDLSVWQIMKAPSPFNLRCPKCGIRIHIKGWNKTLTFNTIASGVVLSAMLIYLFITTEMPLALIIGIIMAIVLLSEILLSLIVINKGTLIIPVRRSSDNADKPVEPGSQRS